MKRFIIQIGPPLLTPLTGLNNPVHIPIETVPVKAVLDFVVCSISSLVARLIMKVLSDSASLSVMGYHLPWWACTVTSPPSPV